MKYVFYLLVILVLLLACKNGKVEQKTYPIISDYSNLFTQSQKDSLTQKIILFEKNTTNEIGIIAIDSLPKNTEALKHATDLASELGIGKKDKNNGLLILIAYHDRQVAIATGYSTELILTDDICKKLIENTIIPNFKNGRYYSGINQVLDSIATKWQ